MQTRCLTSLFSSPHSGQRGSSCLTWTCNSTAWSWSWWGILPPMGYSLCLITAASRAVMDARLTRLFIEEGGSAIPSLPLLLEETPGVAPCGCDSLLVSSSLSVSLSHTEVFPLPATWRRSRLGKRNSTTSLFTSGSSSSQQHTPTTTETSTSQNSLDHDGSWVYTLYCFRGPDRLIYFHCKRTHFTCYLGFIRNLSQNQDFTGNFINI